MTHDALAHPLIDTYFRDLERAASVLPWHERHDLIGEIRGHITEALTAVTPTDAAVRRLLDELGEPQEIVAAAHPEMAAPGPHPAVAAEPAPSTGEAPAVSMPGPGPRAGAQVQPAGPGGLEIAAVLLLLLGGVVLPVIGWVIGVVLLWSSHAWTAWQKVLGTVVVPGGLGVPAAMTFFVSPWVIPGIFGPLVFTAVAVAPLAVAAYLLWAANRAVDPTPHRAPLREGR